VLWTRIWSGAEDDLGRTREEDIAPPPRNLALPLGQPTEADRAHAAEELRASEQRVTRTEARLREIKCPQP
jgi:hypothetical protein